MLKIIQVRFQQYIKQELIDIQVEFQRAGGNRVQIDIMDYGESKGVPEKHILLLH